MAQRITQKLNIDIKQVTCSSPFVVVWFDRQGRPGVYAFEKYQQYSLDVETLEYYRLPLPASHTLRDMVAELGVLPSPAAERVTVTAGHVGRENAKALDAIRHAPVVFQYTKDAAEDYLTWRRIYPQRSPSNEIPQRWDTVDEVTLTFEFDPVYNL